MKKKYVKDKIITLLLGATLTVGGLAIALQDVSLPAVRITFGDADGDDWTVWTPETGEVIQPGHEDDVAQLDAMRKQLETGNYYLTTDGRVVPKSDYDDVPTTPSNPTKEFDNLDALPIGDEYDAALSALDDETKDSYLKYREAKAETCEHDFVETAREEAKCEATGFVSYECSKCHTPKMDNIEALGHQYEVAEEVTATCTEDGYTKLVCSACGDEKIENKVPATGHTEVTEETRAGLFKSGSCVVKCSTCGAVLTNEIIPQIIPMWAAIVGGILIAGIAVFVILSSKKKA